MNATRPPLSVEHQAGIATITFQRPERRNAFSWQLAQELVSALERLKRDDGLAALIIEGEGGDFCVGADLAADRSSRALRGVSEEDDRERLTFAARTVELLLSFPKPTIAVIDGACAGAGLSLALATDLRIASARSVFNTAFLSAGLSGDLGSAWLLNRVVGAAAARSLLLLPRRISGTEAAALGLISEVVPDVETRAAELATIFAHHAPLALAGAKQNLLAADLSFEEYLPGEARRMVQCANSADAREAAAAFLGKRAPRFNGR